MRSAERIQAAVRIFLEEIEVGEVVLPAIIRIVAEEAHAGLLVDEKKPAKIAVELLNSRAHGNEIEIGAEVVKLHLAERFLQADVRIEARGAFAHVDVDDAQLPHVEIVQADHRSHANPPIHRAEGRVAVKQVEGEEESLIEEELLALAEEIRARRAARC